MKQQLLPTILTVGAIALGATATVNTQPSFGGQARFYCDSSTSVPETRYLNYQGRVETWFRWASSVMTDAGFSPLNRCQQVAARLEQYRRQGTLRYITVGQMNGQNVICTALEEDGACVGLIYTLKPGQNAVAALNRIWALRQGQAGVSGSNESGGIPYFDVSRVLGK